MTLKCSFSLHLPHLHRGRIAVQITDHDRPVSRMEGQGVARVVEYSQGGKGRNGNQRQIEQQTIVGHIKFHESLQIRHLLDIVDGVATNTQGLQLSRSVHGQFRNCGQAVVAQVEVLQIGQKL